MNFGGPGFVIAIIAISTFGWIATSWIRARHGYPIENEWSGGVVHKDDPDGARQIELLSSENAAAHRADRPARGADRGARTDRHRSGRAHRPRNRPVALTGSGDPHVNFGILIPIVAIFSTAWMVVTIIRYRHGDQSARDRQGRRDGSPATIVDAQENARLAHENETYRLTIARLEERMAVLERIATDPAERTAREIEQLR